LHSKQNIALFLFCGLCPHPASGIRLAVLGNNADADGIRPGQRNSFLPLSWLFFYR